MSKDPADTSSISFTALYTGHVWYANGMSAPAFHNTGGSVLYHALMPFEFIGKKLAGGDIKTFLLQRHLIIDHLVEKAIKEDGVEQILEIACGMSPRGTRLCEKFPQIKYIEADLPGMAAKKHRLLTNENQLSAQHQVVPLNIFSQDSSDALDVVMKKGFDSSKPVLVITEGLVNYFSLSTIDQFWRRLQLILKSYPTGIYLTDNYPLFHDHPLHRTMKVLGGMLGAVSRSQVSFHFDSDASSQQHFDAIGFANTTIHNPSSYYGELAIPRTRGNPFVRVIEARTGSPR